MKHNDSRTRGPGPNVKGPTKMLKGPQSKNMQALYSLTTDQGPIVRKYEDMGSPIKI